MFACCVSDRLTVCTQSAASRVTAIESWSYWSYELTKQSYIYIKTAVFHGTKRGTNAGPKDQARGLA